MTRTAFLAALEQLLAPLPESERKDALSYYEDYLDAAGPENEARAIAELGSPEEVARKILDEQSPQGASAAPASPAHKPRSTWRMMLGGGLAVLAICLTPFLTMAVQYLLYKLAAFLAGTMTEGPLEELIDALGSAFGLMLGMTGSCALLLLISITSSVSVVVT